MKTEQNSMHAKVQMVEINEETGDQRLDNFLIAKLKGVPKSHIYRIVRKGEVRVNKGRVDVKYRLRPGDVVRIPPLRLDVKDDIVFVPNNLKQSLEQDILYEDEVLMVLNKPAGFAVHGGSGLSSAVIESLRQLRPDARFLELVHRLDRDTSGCLLIAKKRSALRTLHELFRGDGIKKTYMALLSGVWDKKSMTVNVPLLKQAGQSGERMVIVSQEGKSSATVFRKIKTLPDATWVEASPQTGRTHQIRVHAAWLGHPIIGDDRYGDYEVNRGYKKRGVKRLFLHAFRLEFTHPVNGKPLTVTAPLPQDMLALFDDKR